MVQPIEEAAKVIPTAGAYSVAVRSGGMIYLSGQIALDPHTGLLVSGGIAAETHQILDNISAVVAACGNCLEDIVKCTIYLTDIHDFVEVNQIYASRFSAPYPARTTIGVAALPMNAAIEIEIVIA